MIPRKLLHLLAIFSKFLSSSYSCSQYARKNLDTLDQNGAQHPVVIFNSVVIYPGKSNERCVALQCWRALEDAMLSSIRICENAFTNTFRKWLSIGSLHPNVILHKHFHQALEIQANDFYFIRTNCISMADSEQSHGGFRIRKQNEWLSTIIL